MSQKIKCFIVGGAVRDLLLGLTPKDIDYVVVGAAPEWMVARGYRRVGADFPVFLDEAGREWALARTERKSGRGYNGFETQFDPNVTLEDDLARRDLTINAMAITADLDGNVAPDPERKGFCVKVIDPFGGQADLKAGVLRHTSAAFAEDPLRVLRLARFAARFGFTVDPKTLELARQVVASGELDELPKERVWTELEKGLSEKHPVKLLDVLYEVGALDVEPLKGYLGNVDLRLTRGLIELSGGLDHDVNLTIALRSLVFVDAEEARRLRVPSDVHKMVKHFQTINDTLIRFKLTQEKVLTFLTEVKDLNDPKAAAALKASAVYADLVGFTWVWERNLERVKHAAAALKALDYKALVENGDRSTVKPRVHAAKLAAVAAALLGCEDHSRAAAS